MALILSVNAKEEIVVTTPAGEIVIRSLPPKEKDERQVSIAAPKAYGIYRRAR